MKRVIPLIIFILLLSSYIFAEDEPINKTFIINGEKITRWVQQESIEEYDKNGNTVHYKSIINSFLEYHKEYNEKNLLVKFKLQTPFSSSVEYFNYDSQGNKIKSFKETSIGLPEEITNQKPKVQKSTVLSEYSSSNILIHEKSNDPYDEFEYWAELDEQNNITHRKRVGSEAFEQWSDYDKDGHQIHYKEIGESSYEYWLEYNDKGFATHRKQIGPQNYDCFGSYDSKGNLIYEKYTGDIKLERWIEYGKKRIITKKYQQGKNLLNLLKKKIYPGILFIVNVLVLMNLNVGKNMIQPDI